MTWRTGFEFPILPRTGFWGGSGDVSEGLQTLNTPGEEDRPGGAATTWEVRQPVVRVDLQGRLTTRETGSNFVWKLKAAANPSKEVYRAPARHYQCPAAPNRTNIRGIVRDLQATGAFL